MKGSASMFATLILLAGAAAAAESSSVIANPGGRSSTSRNGTWHIIVDPYENGLGGRYFEDKKPAGDNELIEYDFERSPMLNVPGDWNSQREDLLFYEGPVWYERAFERTRRTGKRLFLYFGAVNYRARVYLNGRLIGEHEGGFTPFNFEITTAVAEGRNSLVVEADATRRPDAIPAANTDWWNYGGGERGGKPVRDAGHLHSGLFRATGEGQSGRGGWMGAAQRRRCRAGGDRRDSRNRSPADHPN